MCIIMRVCWCDIFLNFYAPNEDESGDTTYNFNGEFTNTARVMKLVLEIWKEEPFSWRPSYSGKYNIEIDIKCSGFE